MAEGEDRTDLSADKILADLNRLVRPKLEEVATRMRSEFIQGFSDYLDEAKTAPLEELFDKAAKYEIAAITETDRNKAEQYSIAAEDVLRQVRLVLIAEKTVADHSMAAAIENAALLVWKGFKEVAVAIAGVVVTGAVKGLIGGEGGGLADKASEFLD